MPEKDKPNVIDSLRYAEYYDYQPTLDDLYARSTKGEVFNSLMDKILSRNNILLAYRNIKSNQGSKTPGTDGITINDIEKLSTEEVVEKIRYFVIGSKHGYRPKPIRRKEIPKPNGKMRPLGIPCMWDRIIQQCIKQILEPICEAKFSKNSYGFRPNRSVEHAIAETHRLLQRSHLRYVIEFDIKSFFDNVNHSKLIRQMWALGIRDKTLLFVINRILKAPIRMPNGSTIIPEKGTPQGGIISPLLANIVLNELDQWIDDQWINNPIINKYELPKNNAGCVIKSNAYGKMRKTRLKEMYIIRYADDFRIFCRTKEQAEKAKIAITKWLKDRLDLEISEEKTRIVDAQRKYTEFLGFKLRLYRRGLKWVIESHVSDKRLETITQELLRQFKKMSKAKNKSHLGSILRKYNSMVIGLQNYYCKATEVCVDFREIQYRINVVMRTQMFGTHKRKGKFSRKGRELSKFEVARFGKSKALRYLKSGGTPLYPIGYVKPQPPISKSNKVCSYTKEGRIGIHKNLEINMNILLELMRTPTIGESVEFNDNKISLYSAQKGKCAITQRVFKNTEEIHCHHKKPKAKGGTDKYANLTLVLEEVHKLIHAKKDETIKKYLEILKLTNFEIEKLNKLRILADLEPIKI